MARRNWGLRAALLCVAAVGALAVSAAPAQALTASLSPAAPSVAEGNADSTTTFTVNVGCTLLEGSSKTLAVALLNGTATAPADFASTTAPASVDVSCFLGLPGGSPTFAVTLKGDTLDEENETLTVQIKDAGTVLDSTVLTITDDDAPPSVTIADTAAAETTAAGSANMQIPVTLSAISGRSISIPYTLTPGSATADDDFAAASGNVVIAPGSTGGLIAVPVVGDNVDEPDETFTVTLGAPPVNPKYSLGVKTTATATITNDDVPQLGVVSVRAAEGTGGATTFTFNVAMTNPSTRTISVNYATNDVPTLPAALRAAAGTDYTAASGTITFAPGDALVKPIAVTIVPDGAVEGNADYRGEIFGFTLSSPTPVVPLIDAGAGPGVALGFINDDDTAAPGGTGAPGTGGGTLPIGGGSSGTDGKPPAIVVSKLKFKKPKTLTISIGCPTDETSCRGTLSIFTRPIKKSKVKALRKELKLGSKVFMIPGGTTATITVRLSAKNAKAIKQGKTVKVRAFAVARDAASNVSTKTVNGTLKG